MIPFFMPNIRQPLRRDLRSLVADAGLLASLVVCLDAGDANSYPGSEPRPHRLNGRWVGGQRQRHENPRAGHVQQVVVSE